jgi:hypothetical protein
MSRRSRLPTALMLGAALLAVAGSVQGQAVRGTATTNMRYIELRPITQDTVAPDLVEVAPDGSTTYNGIPVTCVPNVGCVYYRSLDVQHAVLATQDVALTSWGWGVQGLSFTALLRGRAELGGDLAWPRANDPFDAILAYGELNRGDFRGRLGRQRTSSTLGMTGYDGANIVYDGLDVVSIEAYGGRSLMRGLAEPRSEALRPVQEFAVDTLTTYLLGASVRYEPVRGTRVGLRYQREIWESRAGLVSERASLDFSTSQLRPLMFDGAVDYDFAFGRIGKAHATVRAPAWWDITLEATARRHLPYFELNTIWGFFSPVGYHEAEGRATWRPDPSLSVWASAGWRRYEEANATVIFRPLEQQGTRYHIGANWRATPDIGADASYRMERGFGAFVSSGDASVFWQANRRIELALDATAFQQIEQFRVGEGVVLGGGASANIQLADRIALAGGATVYRQTFENRPGMADWNQFRAWTTLRAGFGRDPGAVRSGPGGGAQPGGGTP